MSSRISTLLIFVIFAVSALPTSGQQSIAELVAQLKTDVANLQRGLPTAALASNASLILTGIDFSHGDAIFKNVNGQQVTLIGASSEGSGGLWLNNSLGKQIFSVTAQSGDNRGSLILNSDRSQAVWIQSQSNGSGVARFLDVNGRDQATIGGTNEGKGGAVWLNDANGNNLAFVGSSTTGKARISLSKPDGTSVATLNDDNGGELDLYSAAGKAVVQIADAGGGNGFAGFYNSSGDQVVAIGTRSDDPSRGNVWVKGQDFAEVFDAAGTEDKAIFAPGSVVAASPDGDGIVLTRSAYDPAVVGVLSGAGGLHPAVVAGGSPDAKSRPVAIAGQVFVRISTEGGAIRVGDLLVSSSTPGVAMRATDPSHAIGAIVGKALQNYSTTGQGYIRMLVLNR